MTLKKTTQTIEHFGVGIAVVAFTDDPLRRVKHLQIDDSLENTVSPDPHVRHIGYTLPFQFVGLMVVNIVADVFLIGEDLVNHSAGPIAVNIRLDAACIEVGSDPGFGLSALDELVVNVAHDCDFFGILKPAPAAGVINEDDFKVCRTGFYVLDETLERITPLADRRAFLRKSE